ncbi:MAG TPA: aromatic-ring-hydroxylating dioxygenase subunit beta [Acidimicrobiales bacterium]
MSAGLGRAEAEDLLFTEAALIDDRRFEEWLDLFTEDGVYWVPGDDAEADPAEHVSIIFDDAAQRRARIERILHRSNWRDDPEGRLMHLVGNVRVEAADRRDEQHVASNQRISHARNGVEVVLSARCVHVLRRVGDDWRIALKKVCLQAPDAYLPPASIVLL